MVKIIEHGHIHYKKQGISGFSIFCIACLAMIGPIPFLFALEFIIAHPIISLIGLGVLVWGLIVTLKVMFFD